MQTVAANIADLLQCSECGLHQTVVQVSSGGLPENGPHEVRQLSHSLHGSLEQRAERSLVLLQLPEVASERLVFFTGSRK